MKEPDILPEDMDQWEAEYYARKSSGGIIGCIALAGMLIVMVIAMIWNVIGMIL